MTPSKRKGPEISHDERYGNVSSANKRRKLDLERIQHARLAGSRAQAQRDLQNITDSHDVGEESARTNEIDEIRIEGGLEPPALSSAGRVRMQNFTPTPGLDTPRISDSPFETLDDTCTNDQTLNPTYDPKDDLNQDTIYPILKQETAYAGTTPSPAANEHGTIRPIARGRGKAKAKGRVSQPSNQKSAYDVAPPKSGTKRTNRNLYSDLLDTEPSNEKRVRRRPARFSDSDELKPETPTPATNNGLQNGNSVAENNERAQHEATPVPNPSITAVNSNNNKINNSNDAENHQINNNGEAENHRSVRSSQTPAVAADGDQEQQSRREITRLQKRNIRLEEELKELQQAYSVLKDQNEVRERMFKGSVSQLLEQTQTLNNQVQEIADLKAMVTGMFNSFKRRYGPFPPS